MSLSNVKGRRPRLYSTSSMADPSLLIVTQEGRRGSVQKLMAFLDEQQAGDQQQQLQPVDNSSTTVDSNSNNNSNSANSQLPQSLSDDLITSVAVRQPDSKVISRQASYKQQQVAMTTPAPAKPTNDVSHSVIFAT